MRESTFRHLDIEVEDAPDTSKKIEI